MHIVLLPEHDHKKEINSNRNKGQILSVMLVTSTMKHFVTRQTLISLRSEDIIIRRMFQSEVDIESYHMRVTEIQVDISFI